MITILECESFPSSPVYHERRCKRGGPVRPASVFEYPGIAISTLILRRHHPDLRLTDDLLTPLGSCN